MNPKSPEARIRNDDPFEGMVIADSLALDTLSGRSPCSQCGKSRMYFCYTCYLPVSRLKNVIPYCKLPVKVDIIKHRREIDGKSTAAHAAILAPDDVTIHTYPNVPNYKCDGSTVLLYPSTEAVNVRDLFKKNKRAVSYCDQLLAQLPPGHNVANEARLTKDREAAARRRALESQQEHDARIVQAGALISQYRANETQEQRAARLQVVRETMRLHRQSLAIDKQAFDEAINEYPNQVCEVCRKCCMEKQISRNVYPSINARGYLPACLAQKDSLKLCSRCKTHLSSNKNNPPSKAYWNKMDPGTIPDELSDLTDVEKRLLARVIVYVKIIRYEGRWGQYGFKGQAILFAQDLHEVTEKLPNMLPRSTQDCGMVVITENLENITTREFEVNRDRVYRALRWLIANNPLYQDVMIDEEACLEQDDVIRVEQRLPEQTENNQVRRVCYEEANNVSRILHGSWHQGYVSIFGRSSGKQCCAMALANILRAHILDPHLWSRSILDYNMLDGDHIYNKIVSLLTVAELDDSEYLEVANFHVIRDELMAFNTAFKITHEANPSWCGSLQDKMNDGIQGKTLAIALDALFTDHRGAAAGNEGKACVIECDTFAELHRVCKRATGSGNKQYSLDYIDVELIGQLAQQDINNPLENLAFNYENVTNIPQIHTSCMMPIDYAQPAEEDVLEVSDNINEIRRKQEITW
ncbi:DTW domain-containing protein 1 [Eumeta japonica]|uniref:tRNA-uridine aminocarboxypropyltransferase 1 n=1 Tax=Eumeta variegata TaxID=151549 RepID=A0A4C1UYZ8_EUMVA|nr:DTW domain-containing protein 1 [Eumeta japonica]